MANQKKHRWLPYLMVLPAFSIMVLVVVFPIVNTVARSFRTTDGRFTLDNYVYFFTSAEALQSLLFTLAEDWDEELLAPVVQRAKELCRE